MPTFKHLYRSGSQWGTAVGQAQMLAAKYWQTLLVLIDGHNDYWVASENTKPTIYRTVASVRPTGEVDMLPTPDTQEGA
jgi:hypothetical protein